MMEISGKGGLTQWISKVDKPCPILREDASWVFIVKEKKSKLQRTASFLVRVKAADDIKLRINHCSFI